MRNLIPLIVAAFLVSCGSLRAESGVKCCLSVYQVDTVHAREVLLLSDTTVLVKGIEASGFLLTFSIDIDLMEVDSSRALFNAHVITLGPQANTYSRTFGVEYGLPAKISGIRAKDATEYMFAITPLAPVEIDTSICPYSQHVQGTFHFDPSANMDIYYLPNSLGDFYWASVRGMLEEHYRQFQRFCNFTLPGKYSIYLCPCLLRSVIWDRRFGMAIDPTRSSAYAVFTMAQNTADPFVIAHAALLRNYGYAPPFLSEGLANYMSFALLDMKEIVQQERAVRLTELLDTYRYLEGDPVLSDRTSATFVAFLVNQYGLARFKKLYKAAHDLNLATKTEEVYDLSIGELESLWLTYVDTMTIPPEHITYFAEQAETMFDYRLMLRYAKALVERSRTAGDSLRYLPRLRRAYLYSGDYYRAADIQKELVRLDSTVAGQWMTLGSYKMMNGYYDDAYAHLMTAWSLDSTDQLVAFNLAVYHLCQGNNQEATRLLLGVVADRRSGAASAETRIMLANVLHSSPDQNKQKQARAYYAEAINMLMAALQVQPSSPAAHMWLGIASLGQGETDMANNFFEGAIFLESRPFYQGMAHLWWGKLADVTDKREEAMEHYREVLALPAADYHQREARQYLETPYSP